MLEGKPEKEQEEVGRGGEFLGLLQRSMARLRLINDRRGRTDVTLIHRVSVCVCLLTGKGFRCVPVGLETETPTQNHLPGWSDATHQRQTSQTEPQTGAEHDTGD